MIIEIEYFVNLTIVAGIPDIHVCCSSNTDEALTYKTNMFLHFDYCICDVTIVVTIVVSHYTDCLCNHISVGIKESMERLFLEVILVII